jgi:excisionase family DNA binding protein
MAGMFYSLKEAAQKLGVTEDQVKQLAKEDKLREFRDGSNLLFKIEEVDALLAEGIGAGTDNLDLQELTAEEPAGEAVGDTAAAVPSESLDDDIFKLDEETPALEGIGTGDEAADLDLLAGLEEEEPAAATEPKAEEPSGIELEEPQAAAPESPAQAQEEKAPEAEEISEIQLEEPQAPAPAAAEEDLLLAEELSQPAGKEEEEPLLSEEPAPPAGEEEEEPLVTDEAEGSSEEISLAPESGILSGGSDITDMDTALTGQGVNVLGETDTDYNVTEDSLAETAGPAADAGTSAEASLEEIEEDVNLDSFGSGSGLLDLSLQADDTSLGGILDEIYTSEGGEGEGTPAEGEPAEAGAEIGEGASFDEITAEAEHAPAAEEEMAVPEPVGVMPTALAPAYAEAAPDTQSNILGMLLFLPMIALLYTAIVAICANQQVPFVPSILTAIKSLIWYVMGGGVVLALIVFAISFTAGREKAPKAAKPAKAEKAKKEKAPKPEKAAKKGFSLFGKKGKGAAGTT